MMRRVARAISVMLYTFAAMAVVLLVYVFVQPVEPPQPGEFIPGTSRDWSTLLMAFGAIPMVLLSGAVQYLFALKKTWQKILLFLPTAVCVAAGLFVLVAMVL